MPTDPKHDPAEMTVDDSSTAEESKSVGYELTDVNASGIVQFLGGLFGFVLIFFLFCYFMGKAINSGLEKSYEQDYKATDKFHQKNDIFAGALANKNHEREDLKSDAAMEQQELNQMKDAFPNPRLEMDDGNQDTSDLHAREDLLLDHYSSVPGEPLRIPIDRAMELIAARGLPVAPAAQPAVKLAGDAQPAVMAPLTDGFARTGYELDQIEARKQRLELTKPEGAEHAELKVK